MKVGCGTVLFRKFDLERSLAAIREIGYEYFETQAVGPWCPHVNVREDDPEALVRLKNKYGFAGITALWSANGNLIKSPTAVEDNVRTIEWAAAAGIPIIHTSDGKKLECMTDEEAFAVMAEKLDIILDAARKNGVKVAIEPHGTFSLTPDGIKRMMKLGDPDVLGVNFDACNVFRAGYVESSDNTYGYKTSGNGYDELEALRGVADRVIHCHAKDINAQKTCVAVGEGLVNIKGCVEHLKAIGYEGVVSVETEGADDFDQIVALAAKSYEYLNNIIKA